MSLNRNGWEEPLSIALTTSPAALADRKCDGIVLKNTTGVTVSWRYNTAGGRASASGYIDVPNNKDEPITGITNANQVDVKSSSGTPTLYYVLGKNIV